MIFNASRQSFLLSATLCTLLAVLFAVRYVYAPWPAEAAFFEGLPLAASLTRFSALHPWLAGGAAFVLLVWTLACIVQLTVKYSAQSSRNYLPSQIFLITAVGMVVSGEALASLSAVWLSALATRQFVFSFHKGYGFTELFRAGLYSGILPLLYAPAAAIVPLLVPMALLIYRRSGREAIVCFVGLVLPVSAAGFIHWAAGENADFIYREIWRCASMRTLPALPDLVPMSVAVVALLVAVLAFTGAGWSLTHKKTMRKTPNKFMQHISLLLVLLLISAAVPGSTPTLLALVAVPASLTIPYAFSGKWAVFSSIVYCLLIVVAVALHLLPVVGIPVP